MSQITELLEKIRLAGNADGFVAQEQSAAFGQEIRGAIENFLKEGLPSVQGAELLTATAAKETLSEYLRIAVYAASDVTPATIHHLMISADASEIKEARQFAEAFSRAVEAFFDDPAYRSMTMQEEAFLALRERENRKALLETPAAFCMLVVPAFSGEDIDALEDALDWETHGYGRFSVLLVVSDKVEQAIDAHARSDYRLGKYLLCNRMHYMHYGTQQIREAVQNGLETRGYNLSDSFLSALRRYIDAVYPDAVLRGNGFVRDLMNRIARIRADALRFDAELTEADVPFSKKVEELSAAEEAEKAREAEAQKQAEAAKKAEAPKQAEEPEKNVAEPPNEPADEETYRFFRTANQNEINVLLFALSTFSDRHSLNKTTYRYEGEKGTPIDITGHYQLDPVPKLLATQKIRIDHCIILATPETRQEKEHILEDGRPLIPISALTYMERHLKQWFGYSDTENWETVVSVDQDKPAGAISDTVALLRELIGEEHRNVTLYMDQHGGFRNLNLVLTAIVSLLDNEADYLKVKPYNVLYTPGEITHPIVRDRTVMEIFNFVSGINEFTNSGRISSLHEYLKDRDRELIEPMQMISGGILWNNQADFLRGIANLNAYFERSRDSESIADDPYLRLFMQQIRKDYGDKLLTERSPIDILRWCQKKGLYQQALTVLEATVYRELKDKLYQLTERGRELQEQLCNESDHENREARADLKIFNGMITMFKQGNQRQDAMIKKWWLYNRENGEFYFNNLFRTYEKRDFESVTQKIVVLIKAKGVKRENGVNIPCTDYSELERLYRRNNYNIRLLCPTAVSVIHDDQTGETVYDAISYCRENDRNAQGLLTVFLFLHKTMKVFRNMFNHADEHNSFETVAVSNALSYYIDLLSRLTAGQIPSMRIDW